jgi:arylsulfatase A-like enzyme
VTCSPAASTAPFTPGTTAISSPPKAIPRRPTDHAAADESGYYVTTATADHAIECLKDHAAPIMRASRSFQYIAFIAPHFPLHALPQDIESIATNTSPAGKHARGPFRRQQEMGIVNTTLSALERDVGPPYAFPDAMEKLGPGEVNRPLPWSELTEEQRRFQATKMAIHAAMIDRMDQEIGRVIAQLKAMGAFDNTLIFFASDNGASAEIMVRHGGHDPQAAPGSAASTSVSAPVSPARATRRSAVTRPGCMKAASARR